ncbi:DMT family transporter [Hydrogenophaga pseudoflava]|uniref:DMT family transporter n=1 Tax=Hydrogenophaga pseudoflava TaxID=47421 RepID=UPI000A0722DE|nr:DMT family transporter [Hydrogenophaga pseudoflava]
MTSHHKGLAATLLFALILGTIPAITRLAVTTNAHLLDLWLLRCLVGGLLLLPYLGYRLYSRQLPARFLLIGAVLAFCQGWGAHLFSIAGMQFAPASHTSALGPGVISIWVAMWGFLIFRNKPKQQEIYSFPFLLAGAAIIMVNAGFILNDPKMLTGDLFYLGSSCVSAIYLVYLKNKNLKTLDGAAVIAFFSAIVASLVFLASPHESRLPLLPIRDLIFQVMVQGVIAGAFIYVLIGYAISRVGAQQFTIIGSIIPVISMFAGKYITGDPFNSLDIAAIIIIAIGIVIGVKNSSPAQNKINPNQKHAVLQDIS